MRSLRSGPYGQCVRSPQNPPQIRSRTVSAYGLYGKLVYGLYGHARSPVRPVQSPVYGIYDRSYGLYGDVRLPRKV